MERSLPETFDTILRSLPLLLAAVGLANAAIIYAQLTPAVRDGVFPASDRTRVVRAFVIWWLSLVALLFAAVHLAGVPHVLCMLGAPITERRGALLAASQLAGIFPVLVWIWFAGGDELLVRVFRITRGRAASRKEYSARGIRIGALVIALIGAASVLVPLPGGTDVLPEIGCPVPSAPLAQ